MAEVEEEKTLESLMYWEPKEDAFNANPEDIKLLIVLKTEEVIVEVDEDLKEEDMIPEAEAVIILEAEDTEEILEIGQEEEVEEETVDQNHQETEEEDQTLTADQDLALTEEDIL